MKNLLKETINFLNRQGKSVESVLWVGGQDFWFAWSEFEKLADVEYDASYGAPEVAEDLLVVGNGYWLERHEYDGSEWWEFKEYPEKPHKQHVPSAVVGGMWSSLKDLDNENPNSKEVDNG